MTTPTRQPLRLLVPLDGSDLAEQALPYVRMLGKLVPIEVHLLRVVMPTVIDRLARYESVLLYAGGDELGDRDEQIARMREALDSEAGSYLAGQAAALADVAQAVFYEVFDGNPAAAIVQVAAERAVDMIVMVTHGFGGLRRWAVGSVTLEVIRATGRSVFVVRGSEEPPKAVETPQRIMVPLDGSTFAERALPLAGNLAGLMKADLLLTHVVEPVGAIAPFDGVLPDIFGNDDLESRMRELSFGYLDRKAGELNQEGIHATITVPIGHVAEELVEEAQRKQIDLIVLAAHGHTGARQAFLGSVTEKLLQTARVPLIAVR